MFADENCLAATSTEHAPWFVVPADDKDNARIIVSQLVLDGLSDLHLEHPRVSEERLKKLKSIGEELVK